MAKTGSVNTTKIVQIGPQIYQRLRPKLEDRYKGKFVAIDVESEDYFVGDNLHQAIQQARQKHPGHVFYLVKVGFPVVYSFSNRATVSGPTSSPNL